jgi:anti-sigma regulatory factor (Ser/Thr protein kinase)
MVHDTLPKEETDRMLHMSEAYKKLSDIDANDIIATIDYDIDASDKLNSHEWASKELMPDLQYLGLSELESDAFAFGVAEAVNNAIEHVYHFEKGKKVHVRLAHTKTADYLIVMAEGKPIDVEMVKPYINKTEAIPTGPRGRELGFYYMKDNSDLVWFPNGAMKEYKGMPWFPKDKKKDHDNIVVLSRVRKYEEKSK